MTTIKVKFRPSTVADRKGTIYYQIIHKKQVRQLLSGHHAFADEWNDNHSTTTSKQQNIRHGADSIQEHIHRDIERLTRIDCKLSANKLPYTADDIINEFNRYKYEYSLFNFMENVIIKLKQHGKIRTSETYKATLNSFKKFRKNENIMLDCLDSDVMEAYEAWHRNRGIVPNTISFYTRILRAVYNRAVEQEIIENRNPFRHVYTGVDKTVKRALPLSVIKQIKALDLSLAPTLDFARDMFLMSFYLRGMSFIDMVYLKKNDLRNGHVTYRRRKTGQPLTIAWTKEMQSILDKYPENTSIYLLPIIKTPGTNERCLYRNTGYNINHNLKKIARLVGITTPLTLYVARHSWASAAKSKGIPLSVIREGMGHNSETTTQIYLASLDTSVVDRANSLILKSL